MSQVLKNLTKVYIYKPIKTNVNGEYQVTWILLGSDYLNIQQDFNELDRNSTGDIDFETIKLRTYRPTILQKKFGISFKETEIPDYIVKSCPKIGNSVVFTCETYNGD